MTSTALPYLSDRYRIIRELGRGGMATVYLAEDVKHHREVAVKVIRPELREAISAERFLQEIDLTARLQHPHILPLFDSGDADGLLFYVMPHVEGESLRDRMMRSGRLPIDDALSIARDVAAALTWAHQHGVVHRDIKPENILLAGDQALVADFGIALAVARVDNTRLTAAGLSVGTPTYMSPEQIVGDANVDGRSDEYSLACVLFEMLTGEPPFVAESAQALAAKAIVEPPRHARSLRVDVPVAIDVAITKALAKQPKDRFATPREFMDACAPPASKRPGPMLIGGAAVAAAIVFAVIWNLWSSAQTTRARASLAEVDRLAQAGRYVEGFTIAQQAQKRLGADSALAVSLDEVSDLLTITTEPAGATVHLQRMTDDNGADSVLIGRTPVTAHRVPRADYRMTVRLAGFIPIERMVSGALARTTRRGALTPIEFNLPLTKTGVIPDNMVYVPGGEYGIVSFALPIGLKATLEPYTLDRFEVTNEQYAEFVRGGGYATPRFWPSGPPVTRYTDRTGLVGPRGWKNQEVPADQGNHPVTGVSWYEAAAFCASRGKRLPTLYEWEKGARNGQVSGMGLIMPWGYVYSTGNTAEHRANFGGTGTMPVDAHPFGISAFGAYGMAGNVKEWLANPVGDGFALTGGSWQDPAYVYGEVGSLPGTTATEAIGFRCARDADSSAPGRNQGAGPITIATVPKVYRPVDDATFRSLLSFYRYDPKPPRARVAELSETADWRRERIWFDGIGSDSILAYLYLPKHAQPPYQTVVLVPSNATFFFEYVSSTVERNLVPHIKGGRAVLAVVMHGMLERPFPPGRQQPAPSSVEFRDLMVRHATELRMGMDMLSTRPEIDTTRLAYFGISWGAGSRLVFAGVDRRYKAVVLIGAGIDERVQPTLPEAANFNFVPRIKVPKLMVNGRQDEEHPWNTRALPLWNLLREPKELKLFDGVGHHPPVELRATAINEFLDRALGPVRMAERK
jgi:formylglycine-generating enzyme required for sulfatase activity/tRNA A-37 threonylcarbamoyl transferase component Bud32/dienelactone hydrolase